MVKSLLQNNNVDGKKLFLMFLGKLVAVKMFFTYIKQLNKASEKGRHLQNLMYFFVPLALAAAKIL